MVQTLNKLGWKPENSLMEDLPEIVDWYNNNMKLFKKFIRQTYEKKIKISI